MPHSDTPLYRFRGHKPPTARASVLASTPDPQVDETKVATIRLYDPIDSWGGEWGVSAKEFAAALDAIPDAQEIRLHINSPGGEVWEGIAILNALRSHPANVTAIVDGIAASAASFIAAGSDTLVMGRNSQMMIHDARGISIGNAADMHSFGDLLDKISDNIATVYQQKAGGTVASWRELMRSETWYNADEAQAAGLADRVEAGGDAPVDAFDLSMFKHQGRSDAPPPPTTNTSEPAAPAADDATDAASSRDEAAARARHLTLTGKR